MAFGYTEKVLAHFLEPHNVGPVEDADGVGELGDASCGDFFVMFIKVDEGRLADIKYLVRGCGAAIATCSALSDLAKDLTLEEALGLSDDDIAAELGGLPMEKMHCSNLAASVLHRAIADYERRQRDIRLRGGSLRDWRAPYEEAMRRQRENRP
ncbi:MAG: iron-sulfur cluster assembly scaffold protein [Chloroflexi bacterium]|nr:iron-sulfur cluster assembly scaffold protein [Chloroflexota bacterium]